MSALLTIAIVLIIAALVCAKWGRAAGPALLFGVGAILAFALTPEGEFFLGFLQQLFGSAEAAADQVGAR